MARPSDDPELERLLDRAGLGEDEARQRLLDRFRGRLKRMVAGQLDRRLSARVDPSDVVQEALADADRRLEPYLRTRPLPFYPWLRQFARDRLLDLRRRHLRAACRTVAREEPGALPLDDGSTVAPAGRFLAGGTSPSVRLIRAEGRDRVRAALALLDDRDRMVLMLRHVEGLSAREAADVLGVGEEALKSRHRRALERLRALLDGDSYEDRP
jgi:RNA polymerase sigma-70 factor (ECF subfamily)